MDRKNSEETDLDTNPYPIYPDIDDKIDETTGRGGAEDAATEQELVQESDIVNPDPNTLDRG